ncbi:unnamed protein product [Adineta ricciae]|uniref:EGF-like domain-containing protein n=1 Tax=Adineta ricciae TaxID=249248 RepID=A0A816CC15_ADIRI|nr:unnamed protein product [Adineta ricciae]CAF1618421.1 unnamed protein product [Adineta ricciae]
MDFLLIAILLLTTGNLVQSSSTANPCTNYCSQGGVCLKTPQGPKCICLPRWKGKHCEIQEAAGGINSSQVVQADQVRNGPGLCEIFAPNHCLNGGICDVNEQEFICHCKYPFTGDRCQYVSLCYKYCLNNGLCYLHTNGSPKCVCASDNEGERCEKSIVPRPTCDQMPATYCNTGVCLHAAVPPRCHCPEAYTGEQCETRITPTTEPFERCNVTTCRNGATCHNNGNSFYCHCPKRFTGKRCETILG